MKHTFRISIICLLFLLLLITVNYTAIGQAQKNIISASEQDTTKIVSAKKINSTTVEIRYSNRQHMLLDFYSDNIFRLFYDSVGKDLRDPEATPPAKILVENPRNQVSTLNIINNGNKIGISTGKIIVELNKDSFHISILNSENKKVVEITDPVQFTKKQVTLRLKEDPQEYFYGGGVQNGRFSHKGKTIAIENQNSWTDGGVASPTPFYWSTNGYGFMWYTFKKGKYDFGAKEKGVVNLSHETDYVDVFFMVDPKPALLLNDFYQLTGHPVLIPKFGFYEGYYRCFV